MGRDPASCSKVGLNKVAWTGKEDLILATYIQAHGEGKWRSVAEKTGIKRSGRSCRLRWLNYLKPDIKRGNISDEEEDLIIRLHKLLGNRWSLIAKRLPGRTDNEIKNYWNTILKKKLNGKQSLRQNKQEKIKAMIKTTPPSVAAESTNVVTQIITKASYMCTEVVDLQPNCENQVTAANPTKLDDDEHHLWDVAPPPPQSESGEGIFPITVEEDNSPTHMMDFDLGQLFSSNFSDCDFWRLFDFSTDSDTKYTTSSPHSEEMLNDYMKEYYWC